MTDDDEQELVEQLLDIFVFAPIGLALDARELVPKLARRGRNHVDLLRVAGTMAARQGGGDARSLVESFVDLVIERVRSAGEWAAADDPSFDDDASSVDLDSVLLAPARQVVAQLGRFGPDELARLRAHESAGRGRVTVLRNIDRLLS